MIQIPGKGAMMPPTPYTNMLRRKSAAALMGLYATPRRASGMSAMMMSALKITAANTALSGLCKRITFNAAIAGYVTENMAGRIAKYLATSLAIKKS